MGVFFIAAGGSSKNRAKSLERGFLLKDLGPYVGTQVVEQLRRDFGEVDRIYLWGANQGITYNELRRVQRNEYVVDVKNKDVVQVFRFCFYIQTRDTRLQDFIGWDAEKPKQKRRPFHFPYFLADPRPTRRREKRFFQGAFAQLENQNWLVRQRYFSDSEVAEAIRRSETRGIEDLLGIRGQSTELAHETAGATRLQTPLVHSSRVPQSPPPPIRPPSVQTLIERIKALKADTQHQERDHEDLVAEFFEALGYQRTVEIKFRRGRIDVLIMQEGSPHITVEVKADWALSDASKDYIQQAYNYALEHATRFAVITNGDRYLVFDLDQGRGYKSNFIGQFDLTNLVPAGVDLLQRIAKHELPLTKGSGPF